MPRKPADGGRRRICFVTGTRAEFGLMTSVLRAIENHPTLQLQIVATGMHLDPRHGKSIDEIRRAGWKIDALAPWTASNGLAESTGEAVTELGRIFGKLKPHIVLVVGDRVEAFAAAAAAHLGSRIVAHVHGGDRALGQVDDALRHTITKLAHVHFPATKGSAERIARLGEDSWRIHRVGSPGLDGIRENAMAFEEVRLAIPPLCRRRFALFLLHPMQADEKLEQQRAAGVIEGIKKAGIPHVVGIYPNNDRGAAGIIRALESLKADTQFTLRRNVSRPMFLGLSRDAAMLVGNSSSGIIEAASFGTPVIDVGDRQTGRERSKNVTNVPYDAAAVQKAVARLWNKARPRRFTGRNVYGGGGAGTNIAGVLAELKLDERLRHKLIAY